MRKCLSVLKYFKCLIFLSLLLPQTIMGENKLTDQQKLKIVYDMYAGYKKDFPGVKDITPKKAMELLKKGQVVFVDSREPAEMEVSMLPHAITQEEFLKDPEKYKGETVVAYCTISYRSGKFAEEMAKKGIPVLNLKGGLLAWVLEGGKVYDSHGETKRIHVYGKEWDYPPDGYESVKFGFFERLF